MKWKLFSLGLLLLVGLAGFVVYKFYPFIFSQHIEGELMEVERVQVTGSVLMAVPGQPPTQVFSYAVAIKGKNGVIHTASSEDRQWEVTKKGLCVEARFYPYPPWQLDRSGTFHNARLLRLFECPAK